MFTVHTNRYEFYSVNWGKKIYNTSGKMHFAPTLSLLISSCVSKRILRMALEQRILKNAQHFNFFSQIFFCFILSYYFSRCSTYTCLLFSLAVNYNNRAVCIVELLYAFCLCIFFILLIPCPPLSLSLLFSLFFIYYFSLELWTPWRQSVVRYIHAFERWFSHEMQTSRYIHQIA